MKFTDTLWDTTDCTYQRILSHPFIQGQADGALPKETFMFYLEQTAPLLEGYQRGALLVHNRTKAAEHFDILTTISEITRKLEDQVSQCLDGAYPTVKNLDMTPTCFSYTHNVIASGATKSFEECMVMMLSGTWLNHEVAKVVASNSRSNNPYQAWTDHWAADAFGEFTDSLLHIVNTMADNATPEKKNAMVQQHATIVNYEEKFWDSCYKKENWGI